MNNNLKVIFIILILILALPIFSDYHVNSKNVLVLHSYSPSMTWVEEMNLGIKEVIDAEFSLDIQTTIEFLDAKRFNSEMYFLHTAQALKFKYENQKFDAIISCDDHAIDFLIKYRDICFPGIPVFFCGVNNFTSQNYQNIPDIKGIFEKNPLDQNFELIKQLLPETDTIYAVVDPNTKTNKIYRQRITDYIQEYHPDINIQMSENTTFNELEEHLASLSEKTVVLYFSYLVDKNGEYIPHVPVARRLLRRCNRPVFTINKIYLDLNVIGGYVTDPRAHANAATIMMVDYLRGIALTEINELDYVSDKLFPAIFNHKYLEQYSIPAKILPTQAKINDIDELVKRSAKRKVRDFSLIILITSIIAVLLIVLLIMEKLNSREIKNKNIDLTAMMEFKPVIIFQMDKAGKYTYINSQVTGIFGIDTDQVIGKTSREAGFCEAHCLADEQAIKLPVSEFDKFRIEYSVENPYTEENYYCLVQYFPIFKNDEIEKYHGIIIDVSSIKDNYDDIYNKYLLYNQICNYTTFGIALLKPEIDLNNDYLDFKVKVFNAAFKEILNLNESNFESTPLASLAPALAKEIMELLINHSQDFSPVYISDCEKWLNISVYKIDNNEILLNIVNINPLKNKLAEAVDKTSKITEKYKSLMKDNITINDKLSRNQQLLINQAQSAYLGKILGKVSSRWLHSLTLLKYFVQECETSQNADHKYEPVFELVRNTSESLSLFDYLFNQPDGKKEFDLAELAENSLNFFSSILQSAEISIEHRLQKNCFCQGLPNEYALVILNILSNSQDAFLINEISQCHIMLELTSDIDNCTLRIKDNAGGIPEEYLDKIFSASFTTKLNKADSGLGLYICKEIIENKYKGRIMINKSGNGSEFIIVTKKCMM
ncbi:MAG: PAS domain-containing sensor histidine kinase [Candidatus Cloacimonetes bacterium]|nr:PAS domain-containing sensor histidine kinase [Candidatus Cloacimonadota bacterium]